MQIFVRTIDGECIILDIEPSLDKIKDVKEKIFAKKGIPTESQGLVYSGKDLDDRKYAAEYGIQVESTLHLVLRRGSRSKTSDLPTESQFPSCVEAIKTVEKWEALAAQGGFDADTHIVSPEAHFSALEELEQRVVALSEFQRCSGTYNEDSEISETLDLDHVTEAQPWIMEIITGLAMGFVDPDETLLSLCASYTILASVEDRLNLMEQRQFCTNFFSLLVERDSHEGIAEIVNVPKSAVIELIDALSGVLAAVEPHRNDPANIRRTLRQTMNEILQPAIDNLLSLMSCLPPEQDELEEDSNIRTQRLARSVALLLDLGVISYSGSHGSRFDVKYFKREMDSVRYLPKNILGFECSIRPLACLNGFLDKKSVWVFRIGVDLAPWSLLSSGKRKKLSILTTIHAFADIWGPVWAELVEQDSSDSPTKRIKKYHVSKGCIRPMARSLASSEVKCHWFSWPEEYRRRFSRFCTPQFAREPEVFLRLNDTLLIGTELSVNHGCTYGLQEYEMTYNDIIRDMGPRPSIWKLDGGTLAGQFAAPKIFMLQVEGQFKKIPELTVKEDAWQKWYSKPERRNPEFLNRYYGVEISHCSGNARRVPLKQIFLMGPMQEMFERQIPGWTETSWGSQFLTALTDKAEDAIHKFWVLHPEHRGLVGQLVCSLLDVLDSTGTTDDGFRAALLHQNRELGVGIDAKNNEWMGLLKDSYLTATYAILNNICLECRRPNHTTAVCGDERRFSVLQTQIGLKSGQTLEERLKIEPHGQIYKLVDGDAKLDTPCFFTPETGLKRVFRLGQQLAIGKELAVKYPDAIEKTPTKAILQASKKSYGGMRHARNRTPLPYVQDCNIQENVQIAAVHAELPSNLTVQTIVQNDIEKKGVLRSTTV